MQVGICGPPQSGLRQVHIIGYQEALTIRPGLTLPLVDFDAQRKALDDTIGNAPTDRDLISYILYPSVF